MSRFPLPDNPKQTFSILTPSHILPPLVQPVTLPNPQLSPIYLPPTHPFTPQSQPGGASLSHILETCPATPQGAQDMYDPSGAYHSPATTTLGPGNDGFEGELQFYIGGAQAWPGSSALFDYI